MYSAFGMSGWGGNVCKKNAKTPRNPLNSASPQCIASVEGLIIASNPKCRPPSLRFVPGEDMQFFFSEIFTCYDLLL